MNGNRPRRPRLVLVTLGLVVLAWTLVDRGGDTSSPPSAAPATVTDVTAAPAPSKATPVPTAEAAPRKTPSRIPSLQPPTPTTPSPPPAPPTTSSPPPPTTPTPPPSPPTAEPRPDCNANYSPCVPVARDVDCAGGSGNGPAYVRGPVTVIGTDVYGLDRDGDGIGCED